MYCLQTDLYFLRRMTDLLYVCCRKPGFRQIFPVWHLPPANFRQMPGRHLFPMMKKLSQMHFVYRLKAAVQLLFHQKAAGLTAHPKAAVQLLFHQKAAGPPVHLKPAVCLLFHLKTAGPPAHLKAAVQLPFHQKAAGPPAHLKPAVQLPAPLKTALCQVCRLKAALHPLHLKDVLHLRQLQNLFAHA